MEWPAGLFLRMRFARNVYNAWRDYSGAENRVEWLNKHPSGAEIVGTVKSYRFEEAEELTPLERWEQWTGELGIRN